MEPAYEVKLTQFEGPLDLLLHLIKQYEIDIYDIPMAEITKQYMQYIHTMQQLELNIASEYLVMASTLVAIKSQMLLPKPEIDDDQADYEEDPRDELMQRLLEYRKFKNAAVQLKEKEVEANHTYTRPPAAFSDLLSEKPPVIRGDLTIYDMLGALDRMMERKKWNQPLDTKIQRSEISIEERMEDILQLIKNAGEGIVFDSVFPEPSRTHIVVSFLAILELMKEKQVYCKQEKHFDTIYLFYMEE